MKICEYEQYTGNQKHIDYANDLFLDFAYENGYSAQADYYNILDRELKKAGFFECLPVGRKGHTG